MGYWFVVYDGSKLSLALKSGTDVQVGTAHGRIRMVLKSAKSATKTQKAFPGIFLVEFSDGTREELSGSLIQVRYTTQSHQFAGGE